MPIFTARSASTLAWALLCSTATGFCPHGHRVAPRRRRGPRLSPPAAAAAAAPDPASATADAAAPECRVLLLDHVNLNHERGRHDALTAFYFEFLGCAVDPRKYENYRAGAKTVWANIGMQQFHLPEGTPDAQVFDGVITLVYEDFDGLRDRYNEYLDGNERFAPLKDTEFVVGMVEDDMMLVTDPWGSQFVLLPSDDPVEDRGAHLGAQPTLEGHAPSAGLALEELTVHVAHGANLAGIGRFYADVLGAPAVDALASERAISIAMGQRQLLTFQWHPDGPAADVAHHDYRYDVPEGDGADARPRYPTNCGPHISLYVTNLRHAYERAERLGALYVNPRFTRRAYTQDEALEQCMFRIMEIYDPLDEEREVIVSLEHEVRSATTVDGRKYKSCPLLEIPV